MIEERLSRLERSNRRLRFAVAILVLFSLAAATVSMQATQKCYVAKDYVLNDSSGKMRADFCITKEKFQSPGIWFWDAGGKQRMFVGLNKADKPMIQFFNENGEACFYLNEGGSSQGDGTSAAKDPDDVGDDAEIVWPADEKELKKIVYVNDQGEDEEFHRWGCTWHDRKTHRSMDVAQAKDKGKLPCRECCSDMYE